MSCEHYEEISSSHRHHISAIEYHNCVLCAAEAGPLTQEEIGRIFGVSKERINQIEHKALHKLKRKLHFNRYGHDKRLLRKPFHEE